MLAEIRAEAGNTLLAPLADAVEEVAHWMLQASTDDRLAGSYPLLTMTAVLTAGSLMKKQGEVAARMLAAGEGDPAFLHMKVAASDYFTRVIVAEALGLKASALNGAALLYELPEQAFTAA